MNYVAIFMCRPYYYIVPVRSVNMIAILTVVTICVFKAFLILSYSNAFLKFQRSSKGARDVGYDLACSHHAYALAEHGYCCLFLASPNS